MRASPIDFRGLEEGQTSKNEGKEDVWDCFKSRLPLRPNPYVMSHES